MRAALKRLYEVAGLLGGVFMVLLLVFVLYSVGPGVGLWLEQTFGLPNPLSYVARSADEFAGYAMLASAFLALASTFGRGEHIRVTLFLQRLRGPARRLAELWCLGLGTLLSGYLAWFSVKLCWQSYEIDRATASGASQRGLVPAALHPRQARPPQLVLRVGLPERARPGGD